MDEGKFSKEEAEDAIDQLVQVGILKETKHKLKKTVKFNSMIQNTISNLASDKGYFLHLKDFFKNESILELANRVYDQAELIVMLKMMGGSGKTVEISKCSAVLMKMRKIQIEDVKLIG